MDRYGLEGRVAVVTGASEGIGFATAQLFACYGADVVITGRTEAKLVAASKEIERSTGRRCLPLAFDVRDEQRVGEMVARTVDELGRIDILVNNVGWASQYASLKDLSSSAWRDDFALNVDSAFFCTRAAGEYFCRQGSGAIVNVSSVAAEYGIPHMSSFSSAKAALEMLTRVAAAEWGVHGVRVNCVAPGMIATANALKGAAEYQLDIDAISSSAPLRRQGTPEEVANAIVFLASDAASFITGEVLSVRGGPRIG